MLLIPYFLHYLFKPKNSEINRELQTAVKVGCDLEVVKNLLSKGANPNYKTRNDSSTILHSACSAEIVKELLSHGALVNACNANGETPLYVAVSEGKDISVIKTLLSGGADVNIRGATKETLLHCAASEDVIHELLLHAPDVNARNASGHSPLYTAITEGKGLTVIKAFLSAGAYPNFCLAKDKRTFLHSANTVELTRELILFGANVNARDIFGQTPLHVAVEEKKEFEIVQELLRYGSDVNAIDSKDNTALTYAITSNQTNFELIKELLEYKAEINIGKFHSPLHRAVHYNLTCAKLLIKCTLLNSSEEVHQKLDRNIFDLDRYSYLSNKLSKFLEDCIYEISLMKVDNSNTSETLYEIVKKRIVRIKPLYMMYEYMENQILAKYPIYYDIIWPNIKLSLDRAYYLEKLRLLQIGTCHNGEKGRLVVLDPDCVQEICEYLTNEDIKNFIIAFDKGAVINAKTFQWA